MTRYFTVTSFWLLAFLLAQGAVIGAVQGQSCNPYRSGYEKAIAQGIIKRPTLVNDAPQAFSLFAAALEKGDRIETAVRAVQYIVIVSEGESLSFAELERLNIEDMIVRHHQKPVEVAVPMLTVLLPNSVLCPLPSLN